MSLKNQEIDGFAADWVARRDLGTLSAVEEAAFQAWLSADARHLGAYGRAEAVLGRLERLNATALDSASLEGAEQPKWNRRRLVLTGGVAASIAAALGIAQYLRKAIPDQAYSTAMGEVRKVVLADRSVVTLNTDTKIKVRFTEELREISLLQGEALFDVAKNKKRPFIVSAGDTQIRAVGTSFTVSMLPEKPVEVLVKEGVVELRRAGDTAAIPVRASANIQATAPIDAPIVTVALPEEKLVRNLAWQGGQIALDNQSLEDAASEFARYSKVRIVVDPVVSEKTITGLFAANDPVGFAKAAAGVLKLQVEVRGSEVRIY
jgi:transmembrane sensor